MWSIIFILIKLLISMQEYIKKIRIKLNIGLIINRLHCNDCNKNYSLVISSPVLQSHSQCNHHPFSHRTPKICFKNKISSISHKKTYIETYNSLPPSLLPLFFLLLRDSSELISLPYSISSLFLFFFLFSITISPPFSFKLPSSYIPTWLSLFLMFLSPIFHPHISIFLNFNLMLFLLQVSNFNHVFSLLFLMPFSLIFHPHIPFFLNFPLNFQLHLSFFFYVSFSQFRQPNYSQHVDSASFYFLFLVLSLPSTASTSLLTVFSDQLSHASFFFLMLLSLNLNILVFIFEFNIKNFIIISLIK